MVLGLVRWSPRGRRRAVALLTHAMMADSRYLHAFAGALAAAGIEIFALDFRGHGASTPPDPRRDHWGFDSYVHVDLPSALAAVAGAAGVDQATITIVGHSLGGLVAVAACAAGAVVEPASLVLVAVTPWDRGGVARRAVTAALLVAARPLGYLPVRRLGAGTSDENPRYLADLASWVRARAWPYGPGMRAIRCPVLSMVSDRDRFCRPADSESFAARLGGPLTLRRVHTAGHFGYFRRGNEPLRDEIARFIVRPS